MYKRQGFGQPESFIAGRRVFSLNFEKYVAGLSEMGSSTKGSEQLQIIAKNMGIDNISAAGGRMYLTLVYESKIQITTGVVRILS